MLGRERLIIGTKWMLENVRQERIYMGLYQDSCGTSGCWLGWMAKCPALNQQGFRYCKDHTGFFFGQVFESGHAGPHLSRFFNITKDQAIFMFGQCESGDKREILKRLYDVLQEPGFKPEPEIENLDKEWAELQRLVDAIEVGA